MCDYILLQRRGQHNGLFCLQYYIIYLALFDARQGGISE